MPIQLLTWEVSTSWPIMVLIPFYITGFHYCNNFVISVIWLPKFVSILTFIGEYSGGPNEQQTYAYAKTILDLMCKHPHKDGKILIIGGGIANFTNVADTFKVGLSSIYKSLYMLENSIILFRMFTELCSIYFRESYEHFEKQNRSCKKTKLKSLFDEVVPTI